MKRSFLLPLALASCCLRGPESWAAAAQAQDAPPPVFTAPKPAEPPPKAAQTNAAPANATPASAAPASPPSAPAQRGAAELEKLVQPIALHPDPLVAIILPAAAYPVEIVQAARFVKNTNNLSRLDQQPWDDNVKAVARFPELIDKMDAELGWTIELGQAFVEQPKELMDAIQALRNKAQKAGTLQTTSQQIVTVTNVVVAPAAAAPSSTTQVVVIEPANPQVIYVPTYPPTVYYPPPTYVYDPAAPLLAFGAGIAVGAIIANNCDWHGGGVWVGGGGMVIWGGGGHYEGDVDIDIDHNVNIDRGERPAPRSGDRGANAATRPAQQKWQPDQGRMRTSGAPTSAQSREARGWGGAGAQPSQRPGAASPGASAPRPAGQPAMTAQRPAAGAASRPAPQPSFNRPTPQPTYNRPAPQPTYNRPTPQPNYNRPAAQPSYNRPSPQPSYNRPSPQPSSAFSGMGGGARDYSNRGAASRGYGGGGRGGGGGRRR